MKWTKEKLLNTGVLCTSELHGIRKSIAVSFR
jgi:hypothetical protein